MGVSRRANFSVASVLYYSSVCRHNPLLNASRILPFAGNIDVNPGPIRSGRTIIGNWDYPFNYNMKRAAAI